MIQNIIRALGPIWKTQSLLSPLRMFILQKIHIQIEGGTFWVPKVKYLEIILNDPTNNEKKIEKIIP